MRGGVVTVLQTGKDCGGTTPVRSQISTGCICLNGQLNGDGVTWYDLKATAPRWRILRYSDMKLRRSH